MKPLKTNLSRACGASMGTTGGSPSRQNQACGFQNAPADESCTAGVTGGLELLVSRSIVVAAMRTETAYTDMWKLVVSIVVPARGRLRERQSSMAFKTQ